MTLRTGLIVTLASLTLAACDSHPSKKDLEATVINSPQAIVASEPSKSEEQHLHREYGVFATDDAPVDNPELADAYFDGIRLADCPYHSYSEKNRIRGDKFRMGQLPNGILENGPNDDLVGMLRTATGNTRFGSEKDLRVAIIFTGEQFASQARDALKYIPTGRTTLNGQEFQIYRTKTGLFYQTTLESGDQLGILVCGHETFFR